MPTDANSRKAEPMMGAKVSEMEARCRSLARALRRDGNESAARQLEHLAAAFNAADAVTVELEREIASLRALTREAEAPRGEVVGRLTRFIDGNWMDASSISMEFPAYALPHGTHPLFTHPAPAAGGVTDWSKDAREWGGALNTASWAFLESCPEKSILLFNTCKTALREAILKYAAALEARDGR